ncbi:MAG TPA: DUF1552 domain-containing protein [Bryobacteraceae bacterium]|nr:DUF1552 domain-containing protein [Bryobacteraceae bacterium]
MYVTQKHLSRRTFLRGVGAAIALPMLDAMVPAFASAAKISPSPVRTSFVYVPNGIVMDNWTPKAAGKAFEITRILQPLEPFREKMLVISGLMDNNANALGDGGGDHARAAASFLTASHPKKTGGSDIHVGISVDQVIAQATGSETRLPSLELGLDDSRVVGHCDSGYSCAYTNSISWRTPSTPVPPEANPRVIFERLFGDVDTSLDAATRARRERYRKSLLDMARDEAQKLSGTLGASDRRKLDEYLDSIREIERRIQKAEADGRTIAPTIDKPAGIPAVFADHARLLFDLQFAAFQTDLTRVVSMVIGREGSVRTYDEIGVSEPHHPLSHHRNQAEALEKLTKINTFHVELFSQFLAKLAATQDGDATLLDRSMILYGCGIADSNRHTHEKLPILVLGGANGAISTGRHVTLEKDTPVANLFLAMMNRSGVKRDSFGDSTGILEI